MKGIASVIQGYEAGGPVASNPFTAYASEPSSQIPANPFAGLMGLAPRAQYTPQAPASAPPASSAGYRSIYGNLEAVLAEQQRQRDLAAAAAAASPPASPDTPTGESTSTSPGPTAPVVSLPPAQTLPESPSGTTGGTGYTAEDRAAMDQLVSELGEGQVATAPSEGTVGTLKDLAASALGGLSWLSPLGFANNLAGMAYSDSKDPTKPPAPLLSMGTPGISPDARAELEQRGALYGMQLAELIDQGKLNLNMATVAIMDNPNLIGGKGQAFLEMDRTLEYLQQQREAEQTGSGETQVATPAATPTVADFEAATGIQAPQVQSTDSPGIQTQEVQSTDSPGTQTQEVQSTDSSSSAGGLDAGDGQQHSSGAWAKGGYIPGKSGGMDDDVPALIDGKQPARLSSGEFVFDAATVAALGDGNNEAGAKKLNMLREAIRKKAYGHRKQMNENFSVGDLVRLYDSPRRKN